MTGRDEYAVRITRRGTASEPFGWEIVRKADASAVARSSRIFPTRTEALADSAPLFFGGTYPSADRITHVGIYIGGGRMVHAPSQNDVIRVMPVFTGYWGAHYAGAGRVRGQ